MGSTASSDASAAPTSEPIVQNTVKTEISRSDSIELPSDGGSYCKKFGKDKVVFFSQKDWEQPLKELPESLIRSITEDDGPRGVILPNGDINWACPCLGNLSYGPCAMPFREAFSCFHFSLADPKGSDCIDNFRAMTECMAKYPNLYPQDDDKDDDDDDEADPFNTMDKAEKQAQEEEKRRKPARRSSVQKHPAAKETN